MSLPNDICRCLGSQCNQRGQCARFLDRPKPDEHVWVSYTGRLCLTEDFECFIPAEEISE